MIRLLYVLAIIFLGYFLIARLPKLLSSNMDCPRCQGKGHWYGVRHREECKDCNGTGQVPKVR